MHYFAIPALYTDVYLDPGSFPLPGVGVGELGGEEASPAPTGRPFQIVLA